MSKDLTELDELFLDWLEHRIDGKILAYRLNVSIDEIELFLGWGDYWDYPNTKEGRREQAKTIAEDWETSDYQRREKY